MRQALLAAAALCLAASTTAAAKDYILTGVKPDKLVLIDAEARTVEKVVTIPDGAPGQFTIVPSPDGKIAYALVDRWESVAGIDLDTGEQVFRVKPSSEEERVKIITFTLSPDGKELFTFESPVRLLADEYQVQPTRISVWDTGAEPGAPPLRTFDAPRRTALLAMSDDGSRLYVVSWDIYVLDPRTGEEIGRHRLRTWERENYSEPDVLDFWPQWEVAGMFSTPTYSVRTDMSLEDPAAYKTSLATLDLATDEFKVIDFENTAVIIFSTVVNPVRSNEVYGVYTTLSKIDKDEGSVVNRVDLDHTYYAINISSDGSEIYVAGTMDDIAIYDTETLEQKGKIMMPDGADMALASIRMLQR